MRENSFNRNGATIIVVSFQQFQNCYVTQKKNGEENTFRVCLFFSLFQLHRNFLFVNLRWNEKENETENGQKRDKRKIDDRNEDEEKKEVKNMPEIVLSMNSRLSRCAQLYTSLWISLGPFGAQWQLMNETYFMNENLYDSVSFHSCHSMQFLYFFHSRTVGDWSKEKEQK